MAKIHFRIRYPKLLLLLLSFAVAYILLTGEDLLHYHQFFSSLGYFGAFLVGCFYAYGFTAPPAAAILMATSAEHSFLASGLIGGLGALVSDVIIFLFIRSTICDEIDLLSKSKIIRAIEKEERKIFGHFQRYVAAVFAGFLIASPLPTEIGVTIMASLKQVSFKKFLVIAYVLHTAGIFTLLLIGRLI